MINANLAIRQVIFWRRSLLIYVRAIRNDA